MKLSTNLSLPNNAVTQTFLCVGRRGSGKTHTASVLAEQMLDQGWPIIVIDPVGVWWGLRTKYEIVILGGDRGDLPIDPAGGAAIADFLIAEKMPTILDLSEFTEADMVRIVADVASRFYTKTDRHPVHWFIDECDEFSPQGGQATGGNMPKCMGAVQRLVRRGRARGIGVTAITQRFAVLNKSVSTQTECLIAHQITGPQDLDATDDWIKHQGTKEERNTILAALPKLSPGQCYVYSPGWLDVLKKISVNKRKSFDSSATPEPGENQKQPRKLAQIDLEGLSKSMSETVEQAKANDPKFLKARIRELERGSTSNRKVEQLQSDIQSYKNAYQSLKKSKEEIRQRLVKIRELADCPATRTVQPQECSQLDAQSNAIATIPREPAQATQKSSPSPAVSDLKSGTPEFRVLRSLYWLQAEDRTPVKVAFYAGYTVNGHFNNVLGKLRKAGLVDGWQITDTGIEEIQNNHSIEPKPTGSELQDWIRTKLPNPCVRILDVLLQTGERIDVETLADRAGYTVNGHFNNSLGKLRRLQIVEGTAREGIRASPLFF